jgi:probable rRNA maturation factor
MVSIAFEGKLPSAVSRQEVMRLAELAYGRGGGRGRASLSLSVIGDAKMRSLNRQWRGKDRVTDVLSFGLKERRGFVLPPKAEGGKELGDLFICLPQVSRQAKRIGRTVREEFALMVVHGVLHLLGHDHETLRQETAMFSLQHDILIRAGIL